MSTILRALRRLEREQQAQSQDRDLRDVVTGAGLPSAGPRRSSKLPWIAVAAAACLGAAVFAWVLVRGRPPQAASVASSRMHARAAASALPAARRRASGAAPLRSVAAPAAGSSRVASATSGPPPSRPAPPAPSATNAPAPVRPAPAPANPAAALPAATPPSPPPLSRSVAAVAESTPPPTARVSSRSAARVEQHASAAASKAKAPAAAPREASERRRRAPASSAPVVTGAAPELPKLVVEQTIWHPDPTRRVAVVSVAGRPAPVRLHEGDAVGPLVVKEIDPAAVVFVDGRVELRRGVGDTQ